MDKVIEAFEKQYGISKKELLDKYDYQKYKSVR